MTAPASYLGRAVIGDLEPSAPLVFSSLPHHHPSLEESSITSIAGRIPSILQFSLLRCHRNISLTGRSKPETAFALEKRGLTYLPKPSFALSSFTYQAPRDELPNLSYNITTNLLKHPNTFTQFKYQQVLAPILPSRRE